MLDVEAADPTAHEGAPPPNMATPVLPVFGTAGDVPVTPVSTMTAEPSAEPATHAAPDGRVVGVAGGVGGVLALGLTDAPADCVGVDWPETVGAADADAAAEEDAGVEGDGVGAGVSEAAAE